MKKNIFKKCRLLIGIAAFGLTSLTSCNEEPDTSNLYIGKELTIEQMLSQNEELTAFNALLKKTIYANTLSTWGNYTCFAPVNEGVNLYLDSLYNDLSCDGVYRPFHNGIPETPNFTSLDVLDKVAALPDSLCNDLAKYHLAGEKHSLIDLGGSNTTWTTMLTGRYINVALEAKGEHAGETKLGPDSYITSGDNECSNGLLHVLSGMIRREDRLLPDQMAELAIKTRPANDRFSIFYEALLATGLDSKLRIERKDTTYTLAETIPTDRDNNPLYCPTECKVKWTVFAEPDEVFIAKDINNVGQLAEYANKIYGKSSAWYDYLLEKGITVSTGTDYHNEFNALHMFVAYHILRAGMPVDKIVYEKTPTNSTIWNVSFGYEPQEYFETMLPNTLMKVWAINPKSTGYEPTLKINRWRRNNTLTEDYGTLGREETHPIEREGVEIDRSFNKETLNGYIHKIKDILVYDEDVVKSQRERLRLDTSTFLYELINNGIRFATSGEVGAMNGGGNGVRVAFDTKYFDNIVCYNPNTLIRFCVLGDWRANNSDQFQGWDTYDLAFKLPHVPTGTYELRMVYPPMERGGLMQFYVGKTSEQADMTPLGLPFDARSNADPDDERDIAKEFFDPLIGYQRVNPDEGEYGIENDRTLHVRGYMRAPASFARRGNNSKTNKLTVTDDDPYAACKEMTGATSCRTESSYGTMMLRRVVATIDIKQGEDVWFRIKNLINDPNLGWSFDFIELCPTSVVNSQTMMEDWY